MQSRSKPGRRFSPSRAQALSKRVGAPEDFEGIGAFLASDASSFLTGETIKVDGGYMIRG